MIEVSRRALCQALGIGVVAAPAFLRSASVLAADLDKVTIGWPIDVPSWDPEQRTVPDAQPIYKMVFDQPLDQAPDLKLIPKLVKGWNLAPDGLSLSLDFRDDVKFHDGSQMTSADFKYSFFDRVKAGHKIDVAQIWGFATDVDLAVADASGHAFQDAVCNLGEMARLPVQLRRAQGLHGESRRRRFCAKLRLAPVLTSWSITSSTAASCSSATTPIGGPSPK